MTTPSHSLLAEPAVVESIEATLARRGIHRRDLPDAVAEVQLRALQAAKRGRVATTLESARALCNRIARDYAIDESRKRRARAPYDVGLCEDPDMHADERAGETGPSDVDERRLIAVLHDLVVGGELPEHAMAILRGCGDGLAHRASGQELGLTERAVECRLAVIRQRFQERVAALGLVAADERPKRAAHGD